MASFVSGLISGGAEQWNKRKKKTPKEKKQKKPDVYLDMPPGATIGQPSEFRRGGRVRRTGWAKVHRGERVLTRKQARRRGAKKR